jgi:hypothetical protein
MKGETGGLMTFLRLIFVLLICVPVGYLAMCLIVRLIDQLSSEAKVSRRGDKRTYNSRHFGSGAGGYGADDYYTTPKSSGYRGYDRGGFRKK